MSVEFILSLLASGWTVERVAKYHASLTEDDVVAAIACSAYLFTRMVDHGVHRRILPQVEEEVGGLSGNSDTTPELDEDTDADD